MRAEPASRPVILALDTTSESGGVAILAGPELVAERVTHAPDGFGHLLFAEIEAALREAALPLSAVDCFAAAAGPGSFTGVRVGLTAAKGFAEVQRKPMAAISNLRALASVGTGRRRAVILDARRGDVYAAVYDESLQLVAGEVVMRLPAWLAALQPDPDEFITVAGSPFQAALAGTRFDGTLWTVAPSSLAAAVARCAAHDLAAGLPLDPLAADANYVRRADAELLWKDR